MKQWKVAKLNKEKATLIAQKHDIPLFLAMLLVIRNITEDEKISDFLYNETKIDDPFEIKDMDKAVNRVQRAIDDFELICIYGDFDADGVTSTTLLYSYLSDIGANVMFYIPSRAEEGYGMNNNAINSLKKQGVSLIITVDNGISAIEEADYASSLGIDTVITDHHMPQATLPNAVAVVDIHRKDCQSKFKYLSGVGVAFKLVLALENLSGEEALRVLENYSDLITIGTIGDVVPLVGENRVFVKNGLRHLRALERIGISAVIESSGLNAEKISAGNVSFTIVPRINACGRLALSSKSVSLLLSEDYNEALLIASQLNEDNKNRQQIEKEILQNILEKITQNPTITYDRIIVIDGENWHQGVIGIVASRIKDMFDKPVIIITKEDELARGSGRSIEGFSLCDAVEYCKDILVHFGGHPQAVGFSINSENIDEFRQKINEYAKNLGEMPFSALNIDCKLNPAQLSVTLAEQLKYLEPYGNGNPTPLFGLFNMQISAIIPISSGKHIKLKLMRDDTTISAVKFFVSAEDFPYEIGDIVDLAATLDSNEYNGVNYLSVIIKDIKPSDAQNEDMIKSNRIYEKFMLSEILTKAEANHLLPSRNEFAALYRFLRQHNGKKYSTQALVSKFNNSINYGRILVIIDVMQELGIIETEDFIDSKIFSVPKTNNKVDIEASKTIIKLKEVCQHA